MTQGFGLSTRRLSWYQQSWGELSRKQVSGRDIPSSLSPLRASLSLEAQPHMGIESRVIPSWGHSSPLWICLVQCLLTSGPRRPHWSCPPFLHLLHHSVLFCCFLDPSGGDSGLPPPAASPGSPQNCHFHAMIPIPAPW